MAEPFIDEISENQFRSLTPSENVIPLGLVSIAVWISPETGIRMWKPAFETNMSTIELLGLLDIIKYDLIIDTKSQTGE
jgi:hypothetical protein